MSTLACVRLGVSFAIVLASDLSAHRVLAARQEPIKLNLTIEPDAIRFSVPAGDVVEWRLEVVNHQNQRVFDSDFVPGDTLTWSLIDARGERVEDGVYEYTLTMRAASPEPRVQRGQLKIERVRSVYQISALSSDTAAGVVLTTTDTSAPLASPAAPASPADPFRRSLGGVTFIQPLISGNGETNHITKWIDGPSGVVGDTNATELNGNVVIGNGTFKGNLHIYGTATDDTFAGMGSDLISGPAFNYGYAGSSFGRSAGFFNVRPDASAVAPNPSLRFMTANTERMIVTNTGRVGIGTSTPSARLEVVVNSGAFDQTIRVTRYGPVGGGMLLSRRANGSAAAPTAVRAGDLLLLLGATGYMTNGFADDYRAGIDMKANYDWSDISNPTTMHFYTTSNGATVAMERMRIDNDGHVGIGTEAALSERLHVFGNIRVGTSMTNGCVQRFDGTSIAGTCASDVRFKRDITPFPRVLDRVVRLRPVHYYWRSSEFPQRQFGTTQSYGLIAQEVEEVLPELVTTDEQGYKQVDYSKLSLLALQAIKELKAENDALKERLAAIERTLEQLRGWR